MVEAFDGPSAVWSDGIDKAAHTSGVGRRVSSDPCGIGRRNEWRGILRLDREGKEEDEGG